MVDTTRKHAHGQCKKCDQQAPLLQFDPCQVFLDGRRLEVQSFEDYVGLFVGGEGMPARTGPDP